MENLNKIFDKILENVPDYATDIERQVLIRRGIKSLTPNELNVIISQINNYLIFMRESEASDIEIGGSTALGRIWFRVYGEKKPYPELGLFTQDQTNIFCQAILSDKQWERLLDWRATDFSHLIEKDGTLYRWRATVYFDMGHLALNMRAISDKIYPFASYQFAPGVAKHLSLGHEKQGLVLITGITGSGKSTTMDSIIDANNRSFSGHIVIIGDPIEQIHQSKKCIVRHREVGRDVLSFKDGAVQALRQDPDIIVVGEMRDSETIMTCLEITDTGHKVFSTLHTSSAVETIDRIIAECPPIEQERVRNRLADVLKVIISQKLVPTIDGKLILAKEIMVVDSAVKAAIRNNNTHEIYQMISERGHLGMTTLEQDLVRLYRNRQISKENVYNFANNKKRAHELMTSE
ncbi:twitching motility protein PilT [candidate division KSB1 bacterium 4484_87]|nr:MAG: twitching motility protein PilT [candidate division KSB1 bacterium 4484_87]